MGHDRRYARDRDGLECWGNPGEEKPRGRSTRERKKEFGDTPAADRVLREHENPSASDRALPRKRLDGKFVWIVGTEDVRLANDALGIPDGGEPE